MSANDAFWAIVCASYSLGEYDEMISRCKSWIAMLGVPAGGKP